MLLNCKKKKYCKIFKIK